MMQHINPDIDIVKVHSTLYEIKNVFTPEFLEVIESRLEYGFLWNMDRKLQRLSHSGIEEQGNDPFYHSGIDFVDILADIVDKPVQYRIAKLFLDLPGSEVPRHCDANDIDIMLQVYLYATSPMTPGTCFLEPEFHTVDFEYNCGYININSDKKYHLSSTLRRGYRSSIGYQFIGLDKTK